MTGPGERRRASARATTRAIGGAAAIVVALLGLPLLAGFTYLGVDFVRTDIAFVCELKRQLAAGSLWLAPHLGNGEPMFADPQFQLLYPARWLWLWLPPQLGASVGAVIELALGAAGAAWLLRSHGVRAFGAVCFAIAFALSGTALNLIWHASYLSGAAWLPWAWASGRRLLQGAVGWQVRAALVGSLILLLFGGDPQAFAVALAVLGVEVLARVRRARARQAALRLGTLAVAAIAVGLAQWLPASSELALTPRAGALDVHEVLRWSFAPLQWLATVAPGVLQERVAPGTTLWLRWYGPGALAAWNPTPYLGALGVLTGILGVRHRCAWPALTVAALAILVSLGDALPGLGALLRAFPALAVFRYPSKLLLPAVLGAVAVGGVVCQRLARGGLRDRRAFLLGGAILGGGLAVAAGGVLAFRAGIDGWAAAALEPETTGAALPLLSSLLSQAILQGAAPLLLAVALVKLRKELSRAVPLLVCVDLLFAAPTAVAVGPRFEQISSPMVELAAPAGVTLCHADEVLKVTVRLKEETGIWSEAVAMRALAVPNLNACDGLVGGIAYAVVQTRLNARFQSALGDRSAAVARAIGCSHLLARAAPGDEPTRGVSTSISGPLMVVSQLEDPLPAAFVSAQPVLLPTEDEVFRAALGAHSATAVLALIDDPLGRLAAGQALPATSAVTVARLEHGAADRFHLELSGAGSAVVGVRTSFQAGWRARQAGRELPVVRVAGAQLGAVVEDAGAGPIDFEYRPQRLGIGLAFATGGLLVAAAAVFGRRRDRRGVRP